MNTKNDDILLARWLEDDLAEGELSARGADFSGDARLLELREVTRALRRDIGAALPSAEEPPYPEFFNRRVAARIRSTPVEPSAAPGGGVFRRNWWMPLGAAAGMALAFWAGTHSGGVGVSPAVRPLVAETPVEAAAEPRLYTPESGVDAEWFSSEEASATVIVLNGVDAIPDETEFTDSTAGGGGDRALVDVYQEERGRL